eukprot:g3801.t1
MTIKGQILRDDKAKECCYTTTVDSTNEEELYSEVSPPQRIYSIDSSNSSDDLHTEYSTYFHDQPYPFTHSGVFPGGSYMTPSFPAQYYCEQNFSPGLVHITHEPTSRLSSEASEYSTENAPVFCHPVSSFSPSTNGIEAAPVMTYYTTTCTGQCMTQTAPHQRGFVYCANDETTSGTNGRQIRSSALPEMNVETTTTTTSPPTASWIYCAPPPPPIVSNGGPPPPPPYAYHHGMTLPQLIQSPSGYPVICPTPMFYRVVPPPPPPAPLQISPRGGGSAINEVHSHGVYPHHHRRSFSSTYPSTTPTPREVNRVESLAMDSRVRFETKRFHGSNNDNVKGGTPPPTTMSKRCMEATNSACASVTVPQSSSSTTLTQDTLLAVHKASHDELVTKSRSEGSTDQVLSDFKAAKPEQYALKDIKGHLFNFSLDQAGSRFLQEQLAMVSPSEMDDVHVELGSQTSTLMKDVFGNYIVQILLQNGSSIYRQNIATQIKENTLELTLHVYGCRVVQKALEVLEYDEKCEMMRKLERHIARCVKDMNGNHVVQKAIRVMKLENIPFILTSVQERGLSYAVHPYGCRVVQRILECECSTMEQLLLKESIMNKVVENIEELSQDLYGNYVAQHVLRYASDGIRRRAIDALMTTPIDFACHKFASNVVETAVTYSNNEERVKIVNSIVYAPDRGDRYDPLSLLTTNRFGNYVVQKLLDVVENEAKHLLLSSITTRMKLLKRFKYGKHIVNRVEKMLAEQPTSSDTEANNNNEVS